MNEPSQRVCPVCGRVQSVGEFCQACGSPMQRRAPDVAVEPSADTERRSSEYHRREPEPSPLRSDATHGFWKAFFDPTFSTSVGLTLVKIIWFVALGVTVLGLLVLVLLQVVGGSGPVGWLFALIIVGALLDLFVIRLALEVAKGVLQIRDASVNRTTGEHR